MTSPSVRRGSDSAHPREAGIALLASVLLLLMLASIGLASLNVVERDQQVAGYLNRKAVSLHAADAGVARALGTLSTTGTPSVPPTTIGDPSLYPGGQPSYREDTTAAQPIVALEDKGDGGCGFGPFGPLCEVQYWKIRVQGEAPGGSVTRVEVLAASPVVN